MTAKMQRQKILIIEDDLGMVLYYTYALEAEYDIQTATSGKSAIDYINRQEDIDLIILDYKLEDISGIELLRAIKKIKPSIPVILITAYGDEDVAVRSFQCGAKDYIKKPCSYSELFEKIKFCLSLKSAEKNKRITLYHDEYRERTISPRSVGMSHNYFKIQKAVQYVDDNYMTKVSLDTVAGIACISRHHFSRTFKKAMGVTFQDHLNNRRMDKAKDMLKSTKLTITEIALSVGYVDMSHFARIFKRITGFTPSQYKNNSPRA